MKYKKKLSGFVGVGKLVEDITKPIFDKKGYVQAQLYLHWVEIIGDDFAEKMSPNKVVFPRSQKYDGILYVDVYEGWATEIAHMEELITEKLAVYFGYRAISKIKINQKPYDKMPIAKKKLAQKVDNSKIHNSLSGLVGDDDLKNALGKLNNSIND